MKKLILLIVCIILLPESIQSIAVKNNIHNQKKNFLLNKYFLSSLGGVSLMLLFAGREYFKRNSTTEPNVTNNDKTIGTNNKILDSNKPIIDEPANVDTTANIDIKTANIDTIAVDPTTTNIDPNEPANVDTTGTNTDTTVVDANKPTNTDTTAVNPNQPANIDTTATNTDTTAVNPNQPGNLNINTEDQEKKYKELTDIYGPAHSLPEKLREIYSTGTVQYQGFLNIFEKNLEEEKNFLKKKIINLNNNPNELKKIIIEKYKNQYIKKFQKEHLETAYTEIFSDLTKDIESIEKEIEEKYTFLKEDIVEKHITPIREYLKKEISEYQIKYKDIGEENIKIIESHFNDEKTALAEIFKKIETYIIDYYYFYSIIKENDKFIAYEPQVKKATKPYYEKKKESYLKDKEKIKKAKELDNANDISFYVKLDKDYATTTYKDSLINYFKDPYLFLKDTYAALEKIKNKKLDEIKNKPEQERIKIIKNIDDTIAEKMYGICFFVLPYINFKDKNTVFEKINIARENNKLFEYRYYPLKDSVCNSFRDWLIDNDKINLFLNNENFPPILPECKEKIKEFFKTDFRKNFHFQYLYNLYKDDSNRIKKIYIEKFETTEVYLKQLFESFIFLKDKEEIFFKNLIIKDCFPSRTRNLNDLLTIIKDVDKNLGNYFEYLNNLNLYVHAKRYAIKKYDGINTSEEIDEKITTLIYSNLKKIIEQNPQISQGMSPDTEINFETDEYSPFKIKKGNGSIYNIRTNNSFAEEDIFFEFDTANEAESKKNIAAYIHGLNFDLF